MKPFLLASVLTALVCAGASSQKLPRREVNPDAKFHRFSCNTVGFRVVCVAKAAEDEK